MSLGWGIKIRLEQTDRWTCLTSRLLSLLGVISSYTHVGSMSDEDKSKYSRAFSERKNDVRHWNEWCYARTFRQNLYIQRPSSLGSTVWGSGMPIQTKKDHQMSQPKGSTYFSIGRICITLRKPLAKKIHCDPYPRICGFERLNPTMRF